MRYRIGNGYDVHCLEEGCKLILGGVDIPFEKGLLGHSDADVLVHAIIDALLGAAALGDIGQMFPDSENKYFGISSIVLLKEAYNAVKQNGFVIGNADAIVVAQEPRLSPFISGMRQNIARALDTDVFNISVKATTEEHLGFTGNGSGIAAHAVCILERNDA